MNRLLPQGRSFVLVLTSLVLVTGLVGCFPKEDRKSRGVTTLDAFKSSQARVQTPYGKIKMETVREINGQIEYQTADGRTWRVTPLRQVNGAFKFTDLQEVK